MITFSFAALLKFSTGLMIGTVAGGIGAALALAFVIFCMANV